MMELSHLLLILRNIKIDLTLFTIVAVNISVLQIRTDSLSMLGLLFVPINYILFGLIVAKRLAGMLFLSGW